MRSEQLSLQHGEPMSFAELVRILLLNVWQILGLTVVVVAATLLYAYSEVPLYKASATLLIEPRVSRAVELREVYDAGVGTDTYYATQIEIIRSKALAGRVVEKLKLDTVPVEDESRKSWLGLDWRQWLPLAASPESDAANGGAPVQVSPEDMKRAAVSRLMLGTFVEAVPRTQLLRVNHISSSKDEAARIANALAEAYIDNGLESRLEASRRATTWLTEKLGELRGTLESAEKNVQAFRDREQLVNVGGARALVEEELLDGTRRLREAQKISNALSATYRQIQQAGSDAAKLEQVGDLIKLPLVQSAKGNVVAAEENLKQLQQRYGDKHPLIAGAQTRQQSARKTFQDQLLLAAQNVRSEFELARNNESLLNGSVAAARERIRGLDKKQYEFGVLQREVSSNEQLYNLFLSSFKQTDSSSSFEPINARILQAAEPPTKPFSPDFRQLAIKSALAGLVLALILVGIRQLLDESVRSAEELEAMADVSVMGVLPKVGVVGRRRNLVQYVCADSRTAYAEGVRGVRANLQLNDIDKRYRKIMITSTVPGEGKSSLAACLAMAFAASEKVLLIEGDMRAPSLKKMFGIAKTRPGLMEVLGGEAKLDEAVFVHEASKLGVLAVGKRPANPAEVIGSAAFVQLLKTAGDAYDRIIIDSPPLQAASDGLVLAKISDAVIFTVKADETRRRAVVNAVKQLRNIQASPLGAVINQVSARRNPSYSDHYYAKGYYG